MLVEFDINVNVGKMHSFSKGQKIETLFNSLGTKLKNSNRTVNSCSKFT